MSNVLLRMFSIRVLRLEHRLLYGQRKLSSSSSRFNRIDDDLKPPETCCMSNCPTCVWIVYAEEIARRYPNATTDTIDDILKKYIDDKSFREFIQLEIKMRSIIKK